MSEERREANRILKHLIWVTQGKYDRDWALEEEEFPKLWNLCLIHTPHVEMAHFFDFNFEGWMDYINENPRIRDFIERGRAEGSRMLRQAQWDSALRGNTTMQVWLGRVCLGQDGAAQTQETGQPLQLADISAEARKQLIELKNAIYNPETKEEKVIEMELAPANSAQTESTSDNPGTVGSPDGDETTN